MREKYQAHNISTTLSIVENRVSSIRKKDLIYTGCRVYDGNYMGVSGALGEATEDTWKQAQENLKLKIEYPFEPTKDNKQIMDRREYDTSDEELQEIASDVLSYLTEKHPQYTFKGKIQTYESRCTLSNECGLDLGFSDKTTSVSLEVKDRNSINIYDSYLSYGSRKYDKERFIELAESQLTAFLNPVELPKDEIYIIMDPTPMLRKLDHDLNGEAIGRGTSLLTNKLNTQVFSPKLNIYKDSTADEYHHCKFFDAEGIVNEGGKLTLIQNGVPLKPYTDKRTARDFNFELTGNASAGYDDVPMLGGCLLNIEKSDQTLKELLNGRLGMIVHISSGGDFTATGDYATPVQLGFLTDGERLIGRLPECNIKGNIFDILGEDYIGYSKDKKFMDRNMIVVKMKLV